MRARAAPTAGRTLPSNDASLCGSSSKTEGMKESPARYSAGGALAAMSIVYPGSGFCLGLMQASRPCRIP